MKILLIKDVFKLGRAGDVKKVADGYGRNFLIPQGMAILATPGAIKQADRIRAKASERRDVLNNELGGLAAQIAEIKLTFPAKAGDTGKLYGSITTQQIADAIEKATTVAVKRQQIEVQPIRTLGEHSAQVRFTMDLAPEFKIIVYREGEAVPTGKESQKAAEVEEAVEEIAVVEEVAEVEEVVEEVVAVEEAAEVEVFAEEDADDPSEA